MLLAACNSLMDVLHEFVSLARDRHSFLPVGLIYPSLPFMFQSNKTMKRATKRRKRHVIPGPAGLVQQRQQLRKHGDAFDSNHEARGR
jgi:hypothetical protein